MQSTYGRNINVNPSRYGFEENFEDSQYSEQSEDIIIVEQLNEQEQIINKSNAMRLTGQVPQHSAIQKTQPQSQIKFAQSVVRNPQQQSQQPQTQPMKQTFVPGQVIQRNFDLTKTQKQQPIEQSRPTFQQQSVAIPRQTINKVEPRVPQYQQQRQETNNTIPSMLDVDDRKSLIEQQKPEYPIEIKKTTNEKIMKRSIQQDQSMNLSEKKNAINKSQTNLFNVEFEKCRIPQQDYQGPELCEVFAQNEGKLTLNPDLGRILGKDDNEISFISIAGMSKSGKSTLFNLITNLGSNKIKFGIQGVIMYTKPIQTENRSFYFIDCSSNTLAHKLLFVMSTTLLFNTVGNLNSKNTELFIALDELQRELQNIQILMPQLIWVQRDTLQQQPISVLISMLYQLKFGQLFDENIKQKEVSAIAEQGTSEYHSSIISLRDKIMLSSTSKQINGVNLNGPLMIAYLDYVVQLINNPKPIVLEQLWSYISEDYTKYIYNRCLKMFVQKIDHFMKTVQIIDQVKIYEINMQIRESLLYILYPLCYLGNRNKFYPIYKLKLQDFLTQREKLIKQYFCHQSQVENELLIEKLISKIDAKDHNLFIKDFDTFLKYFDTEALPIDQCYTFSDMMHKNYPKFIKQLGSGFNEPTTESDPLKSTQLQAQLQNTEEQLEKLKKNFTYEEKKIANLKKQIEDIKEQIKIEQEPDNIPNRKSDNDELLFNMRQDLQKKTNEANQLKKQIQLLKNKQKEDEGCYIF